ncbi:MAG: hypothetical protein R3C28_19000 [Pirellulaceae bacterium]
MKFRTKQSWQWAISVVALAALLTTNVNAFTPESPEVREMLDKAVKFLGESDNERRLGGVSIIGLGLVKGDAPKNHPKILRAVAVCKKAAKDLKDRPNADIMYDLGVSIIFLCELDPEAYAEEIKTLTSYLFEWQKEFGGWGYLAGSHADTGDTSMTQYAVLANWMVVRTGVMPTNEESVINVLNWLIRTQDVGGGWGYQGVDPGSFQRASQHLVSHSLTAAGCGSVYMCADLLRLTRGSQQGIQADDGLPLAFREVKEQTDAKIEKPLTDQIKDEYLRRAMDGGANWLQSNYSLRPPEWQLYYLYALERFHSFKELAEGRMEKSPKWYNDGVDVLRQMQKEDGSWDTNEYSPQIDTCFAIFFLTRGTQKTIAKAEGFDGRLRGGKGLPTNLADATVGEDGRIVKSPFQGKAESLLSLLEANANEDFDALSQDIEVTLSDDPEKRETELVRLRRLVADENFNVRFAAIKALEKTRNLDNVPVYIYGLGDPDRRVVVRSRDALRSLSRKFDGFGLSDNPSEGEKLDAIEKWKDWYLTIRPDAQFLN